MCADARPLTEDWLLAIRLNLIADGRLGDRDAKLLLVEVDRLRAALTQREQDQWERFYYQVREQRDELLQQTEQLTAQLQQTAQARDEARQIVAQVLNLMRRDRAQGVVGLGLTDSYIRHLEGALGARQEEP